MGLESSPTTIAALNALWPLSTDDPKYGDDHVRNIKAVLVALDTAAGELRGRLVSVQKFTSSGTWTKPVGCRYALVKSKGGGGGGAGAHSEGEYAGAGGGEGGYCEEFLNLTSVSTVTVTVGTGGAGGVAGENGANGVDTTFGAYHTAGGGEGGKSSTLDAGKNYYRGGAGGAATGGDINLPGACGHPPIHGMGGSPMVSGAGGGQGGGRAKSVSEDGVAVGADATTNSGGGGGGAYGNYAGGAGGSGFVVVYEYT